MKLDKKLELKNLDPDQRAFIYQQTELLQPFVSADAYLLVKVDVTKNKKFRVRLTLLNQTHQIEARANTVDFFSAVSEARDQLMGALSDMQNEGISSQDREIELREAEMTKWLH